MKTKGNAAKIGPWTDTENAILAHKYLVILDYEKSKKHVNKAQHRREGIAAMAGARDDKRERSHGSWEMKMCNASAVMAAAGLPFIQGYKPLGHGQARDLARALAVAMLAHGFNDDEIVRMEALTK